MVSNITKVAKGQNDLSTVTSVNSERMKNRPPPDDERGIASLAHEINNPLEALRNLLYLIEQDPNLTENSARYLTLARDEAQRISQISHDAMHQFQEAERPEDTNVPRLLASVLDFYYSRFASQGITVSTRYCHDGTLFAYPRQLRQMLSNLLMNAADAMPRGGRIHARVCEVTQWRRGLRITIADTGTGIAAKDLPRIMDPFFTTKGDSGTGIGLSLVKNTVQKHGGLLRVKSSTSKKHSGTIFTVFLPEEKAERMRKTA